MNRRETATLLAKVQLGDNRVVDALVIEYWHDTIGDLEFDDAMAALRSFRRERPGTYLEPGHLLELAGVVDDEAGRVPDITEAYVLETKARALAAAGVSEEEWRAHATDRAWLEARFGRELGAGR